MFTEAQITKERNKKKKSRKSRGYQSSKRHVLLAMQEEPF
jgi:hypothetical protein